MKYSNLIFVYYPSYAGGKFLINCLGLSNDAYLQDINLATKQLNNNLTPTDKLNVLLERLKISYNTNTWNDLDLGCLQLFGSVELDTNKWSQSLLNVINSGKLVFMVYHGAPNEKPLLDTIPDKKIIKFTNTDKFIKWRNFDPVTNWSVDDTPILLWDPNWYFDQEQLIIELRKCYNILGLTDFNESLIRRFHNKYIETLEKLK